MANLKNWQPDMSTEERIWFDACPKAVLFEIARQFGMRVGDEFTADGAFAVMKEEWRVLHSQNIVPQRPVNLERKMAEVDAYLARVAARQAAEAA